jgi:hypothetical protein
LYTELQASGRVDVPDLPVDLAVFMDAFCDEANGQDDE